MVLDGLKAPNKGALEDRKIGRSNEFTQVLGSTYYKRIERPTDSCMKCGL